MVERKTLERDSVLERFDMDQNIQRPYFFTSVGRIHREVRHGYTNSDGLKKQKVYKGGEKHEENTVRSGTAYTRGVYLVGDGKRRLRSSKNTKTGWQM